MDINFVNTRSVIIFICLLQCVVFAGLLIRRGWKRQSSADWWLAALLIFLCSSLITPFIGFAGVYNANQWLTYFPFYLAYTYSVCVYFYVTTLTDSKRRFELRNWALFIPAAVFVVFRLILFAQDTEFKGWFNKNYYVPFINPLTFVTEFVWNLVFLWLAIKHYRKYRAWLGDNFSDIEKIKFDWLRNFLNLFTFVFVAGGMFDFIDSFIVNLSYFQYFYLELLLAATTYYLAIAGYLRTERAVLDYQPSEEPESGESFQFKKPLLAQAQLGRMKNKLQILMERDRPYLDSQLTLSELARQSGLNSNLLSHVINQGFGKNFNDFVNEYRIAEVKRKLDEPEAKDLTLMGVAIECGFNSKATFNRAFKKITGISPKEFQAQEN